MGDFQLNKMWCLLLLFAISISCQSPKTDFEQQSLPIIDSLWQEASISTHLQPYKDSLQARMSKEIGVLAVDLTKANGECSLGNWIADLMLESHNAEIAKPDFSLVNIYGLRKELFQGPITVGDIYELMPFENELWLLELSGSQVLELLDLAIAYQHLSFGNLRIVYHDGKLKEAIIDGKQLVPGQGYKMLTSDYLATGGDKLEILKEAVVLEKTGVLLRDHILAFVIEQTSKGQEIGSKIDGRFRQQQDEK